MSYSQLARRRLLATALAALLGFVFVTLLVATSWGPLLDLDRSVGTAFVRFTGDHDLQGSAATVARLTRPPYVAVLALVVVGLLLLRRHVRTALWVALVFPAAWLSGLLLKTVVDRHRPPWALQQLTDLSYPSGHAVGAATAAGISMVLAATFLRRRSQRRLVGLLVVAFALLVGADRLLLGVHHLSDVVGGFLYAATWVAGSAWLLDPSPQPAVVEPLAQAVPTGRRLAVILNPIKVEDAAHFRTQVESRAAELGWDPPVWFTTTIEDPGTSMAHDAAVGGADLVVVCGGDGTVRTVCAELAGTGIPVGVIPAGTGNLLARNLALPLYLKSALEVALNGQDRAIDLVHIIGDGLGADEHFLVMAGMGFDAAIMEGVNEQIKARVGWLAYVVSGFRHLMFTAVRVEISVDGAPPTKHRARTIVVGNVGFLQGGLPLLPDATLDDGRLDVVLINPRRFLSWLRVVVRVVGRQRKTDTTVDRMTGRRIEIRAAAPTPRQIDGDSIGPGTTMVCECLPGKLLVRVPR